MLRSALVLFYIALAVQAKPRKDPLTDLFGDKVKPFDVADEPENKIVGGTEVTIYFTIWWKLRICCIAEMRSSNSSPKIFNQILSTFNRKKTFCQIDQLYQIAIILSVNDTGHLQIIESLISRIRYLSLFESITPVIRNHLNFFQFRLISLKGLSKLSFCMMDLFDVVEPGWEAKISWLPVSVVMELGKLQYI